MNKKKTPPIGARYGKLTVTGEASPRGAQRALTCVCDCGKTKEIAAASLNAGRSKSCGCMARKPAQLIDGAPTMAHPVRKSWEGMRQRCNNPNSTRYADYGGKGIAVCEEWNRSFAAFARDMGTKPTPAHSLDRIDNAGPYTPENCKWSTPEEQASNTRKNRHLTHEGETLTIAQWSRRTGIAPSTISRRIHTGWNTAKALTTQPTTKNR